MSEDQEKRRASRKRYDESEKGKARQRKYRSGAKWREAQQRYATSEKGLARTKRYRESDVGRATHEAAMQRRLYVGRVYLGSVGFTPNEMEEMKSNGKIV